MPEDEQKKAELKKLNDEKKKIEKKLGIKPEKTAKKKTENDNKLPL